MTDFLFVNGPILTMDPDAPRAEVVLVRGEQIAFVGSEADVQEYLLPYTEVINLKGQCLMPGFHDSHVHLVQHGLELARVDLSKTQSKEEGLALIAEAAKTLAGGEWLLGSGFLMSRWGVDSLPKDDLDKVTQSHPVFVQSQDHHSAWVNSLSLRTAGISETTADLKDGVIVRSATGEPTGLLLERALNLVRDKIPPLSRSAIHEAVLAAGKDLAKLGVTTVHTMAAEPASYWQGLATETSQDNYPLRVWACIPQEAIEHAAALGVATGQGGKNFQVGGAKFFVDGALGSLTALMLGPYPGTTQTGVEVHGYDVLKERVPLAIKSGLVPVAHAIGDKANQVMLTVLENCKDLWRERHMRPRIEHAQHLHADDIKRFAKLGVIASMQPIHFRFDADLAFNLLGERMNTTHAWRALHESGATLAFGSDTPVASPDIIQSLLTATTRRSEKGAVFSLSETLSLDVALAAYTRQAAYAIHWEDRSGQIKPTFDADLVTLSHNPFDSLEELKIMATMKAGVFRYEA